MASEIPFPSDRFLHRNCGSARVGFVRRGARTVLVERFGSAPLRLFSPYGADAVPEAVLANVSGGVAGGDRLGVAVVVGPGADAAMTTQAAEKVYRALDVPARIDVDIRVGAGAAFEWLPQETILFDGARLGRSLSVDLGRDARALLAEMLVFGRAAFGERFGAGMVRDRWLIDREGRPVWRDTFGIDDDGPLHARSGLGGKRVLATLIYVGGDAGDRLDAVRALAGECGYFVGATCVRGLLVVRFLAEEAGRFKAAFAEFVGRLRALLLGRPPLPPRVWLC